MNKTRCLTFPSKKINMADDIKYKPETSNYCVRFTGK